MATVGICDVGTARKSDAPAIVFFQHADAALRAFVRAMHPQCHGRLLGVAVQSKRLHDHTEVLQLLDAGAADVLTWEPQACAGLLAAKLERWAQIDAALQLPEVCEHLIGNSPAWVSALRQVIEVARFADAPVLITGESGTGKELAAHLIHRLDPRTTSAPLVVLDCTTVVADLSGSEFFGHERGAYTGAAGARDGAFARAHQGTLFLDEVGELPLPLQAQLLRVIQEHTYKRVGGNAWQHADFRLVCATHRDLQHEVTQGRFRQDLYYRIASCMCTLPPLRDRPEDILPLAHHFMRTLRSSGEALALDATVQAYLLKRAYPGNVRDLKQVVTRMLYRHAECGLVTVGDIPDDERPTLGDASVDWQDASFERVIARALISGAGLKEISKATEALAVHIAMRHAQGNIQRAASVLGVTDRALQLRRAQQRSNGETAPES
jgi:transcriptional regulator with GAF, ATPase, and Fis domain